MEEEGGDRGWLASGSVADSRRRPNELEQHPPPVLHVLSVVLHWLMLISRMLYCFLLKKEFLEIVVAM